MARPGAADVVGNGVGCRDSPAISARMVRGAIGFGLLFATARARNGFAGLHELLTGTRVVSRLVFESGPVRPHPLPPPIVSATAPRLAHYVLLDEAAPPGVVVGYDETLARRVWIRHGTPGAPPVPLARRQVSRPSRLHWLAGGRDDSAAWDVYEMAAGEALRGACRQPRSWPVVRGWLFDLADEIVAASEDGTGVPLTPGASGSPMHARRCSTGTLTLTAARRHRQPSHDSSTTSPRSDSGKARSRSRERRGPRRCRCTRRRS